MIEKFQLSPEVVVSSDLMRAHSALRRVRATSGFSIIGAKASTDSLNVVKPSGPATTVAERGAPSIIEISPK